MLVAQIAILRISDEKLNEAHEAVDILLVRPVVIGKLEVVVSLWTFDSRRSASAI